MPCVSDASARIDIIRSSVWHVIMSAYLLFRSSFLQVSLVITGRQLRSRAPGARIRGRCRHDSSSSARYWHTQQRDKEPLDDATDRVATRLLWARDGWHWICVINLVTDTRSSAQHETQYGICDYIMTRRRSRSAKALRYLVESIIVCKVIILLVY